MPRRSSSRRRYASCRCCRETATLRPSCWPSVRRDSRDLADDSDLYNPAILFVPAGNGSSTQALLLGRHLQHRSDGGSAHTIHGRVVVRHAQLTPSSCFLSMRDEQIATPVRCSAPLREVSLAIEASYPLPRRCYAAQVRRGCLTMHADTSVVRRRGPSADRVVAGRTFATIWPAVGRGWPMSRAGGR